MKIPLEFAGKQYLIEAQNIRGTLWVHLEGRTFIYESAAQLRRTKKSQGSAAKGEILAPMPGKITKILKELGSQVLIGDAVLVMEAMKMEYTLKAAKSGIIEHINCQIGEQVTLGKKLAHIEGSDS
jgi:acetyl/propionyl-CoA carboxylase alpha subunit